jgi:hypothetical protein
MSVFDPELTVTTVRFGGVRLNQELEALAELKPPFPTTCRKTL